MVRVDAWVWAVRLLKTRSQAAQACRAGHVKVNGESVKPAQHLAVGDRVRVWAHHRERIVEVQELLAKRVGQVLLKQPILITRHHLRQRRSSRQCHAVILERGGQPRKSAGKWRSSAACADRADLRRRPPGLLPLAFGQPLSIFQPCLRACIPVLVQVPILILAFLILRIGLLPELLPAVSESPRSRLDVFPNAHGFPNMIPSEGE